MREGDTVTRSESTGGQVRTAAGRALLAAIEQADTEDGTWTVREKGVAAALTGYRFGAERDGMRAWVAAIEAEASAVEVVGDGTGQALPEAAPSAGLPAEALLREVVRNGVPPDALMTPKDGPAHENLYRWWHEQWAPTLQKVRVALAAAPETGLPAEALQADSPTCQVDGCDKHHAWFTEPGLYLCRDHSDAVLRGAIAAAPEAGLPDGLDVEQLDRDLHSHFGEMLSPDEYAAIRSIAQKSLGNSQDVTPEQLREASRFFGVRIDDLQARGILARLHASEAGDPHRLDR